MNKTIVILVLVLLLGGAGFYIYQNKEKPEDIIVVTPPSPIVYKDLIKVDTPLTNALVSSPLKITGSARGNWYFEASFPVFIYDANGKELGVVPAQAKGEWMTSDYVPFETSLTFTTPTTETGTLVLRKDNPSGLSEHDDSVTIPIRFKPAGVTNATNKEIGTLAGEMTIGPVCPVEREGQPCNPTAEMYAARKIFVSKINGTNVNNRTLVATLTPNAEGKFSINLPVGNYYVDVEHFGGPGGANGVPTNLTISPNKTTSLKIDIDTGIR